MARFLPFIHPTPDEIGFLASLPGSDQAFPAGETIEGSNGTAMLSLMLDGWAANSIVTAEGSERIHAINLPGDMLGMMNFVTDVQSERVFALTPVICRQIPASSMWDFFESQPRLAASVFLIAQEERAARKEWHSLGTSTGAERRLAACLFRLGERCRRIPGYGDVPKLPLNQKNVSAIVGVTAVYINRIMGKFRDENLIEYDRKNITILDLEGLQEIAELPTWEVSAPSWLPRNV